MIISNINLGKNVDIADSSSINNVVIGDDVKISKHVDIFGNPEFPVIIRGYNTVRMHSCIMGYEAPIIIEQYVNVSNSCIIMSGTGGPISPKLAKLYPVHRELVHINEHSWLGVGSIIMPGVTLGRFTIVAANSFVNKSFPDYSIIGGTPAKLIRHFTPEEIAIMESDNEEEK